MKGNPDNIPGMGLGTNPIKAEPPTQTQSFGPIEPQPQAPDVFDPKPLQDLMARTQLPVSPNLYLTSGTGGNVEFYSDGKVDIARVKSDNATLYCAPADEELGHGQRGQDAGGLIEVNGQILAIICDGKSQAYLSELGATEAVVAIATTPTVNLADNLSTAVNAVQVMHKNLPLSTASAELVRIAQSKTRVEAGTQTMIGQVLIDPHTGQLDGVFLMDGGIGLFNPATKTWNFYPTTTESAAKIEIGSKRGIVGKQRTLSEIVGREVVLQKRGRIIVFTDGLLHTDKQGRKFSEKVAELLSDPQSSRQKITDFLKGANTEDSSQGDDITLFDYVQT